MSNARARTAALLVGLVALSSCSAKETIRSHGDEAKQLEAHVHVMEEVFGSVELFNGGANVIVAGSLEPTQVDGELLRSRARELDAAADYGFAFEAIARTRTPLAEMFGPTPKSE